MAQCSACTQQSTQWGLEVRVRRLCSVSGHNNRGRGRCYLGCVDAVFQQHIKGTQSVPLCLYICVCVCRQVCVRMYVIQQFHQCKHIDLSMGCLVHCVTLPMVQNSKLITHDEMINLVYVPLSVQCTQPYVLPVSLLTSEGFLLGAQPRLISLSAVLLFYRLTKRLTTLFC